MTELESKMRKLIPFLLLLIVGCSSDPVNMDEVLYERAGQYITNDNFHSFFFFNQKVYNGPGFMRYRTGEKREQGILKNGFKSGAWIGYDKKGKKKFVGDYQQGKAHGKWTGFHPNGEKKYEGVFTLGFQLGRISCQSEI